MAMPNLGLTENKQQEAVDILQTLLADEFVLYTKLRNYHWNVKGHQFKSLHELFEEQYTMLEAKIDEIAERARTYGVPVIGTLQEFSEKTRLSENPGDLPNSDGMVESIADDHEAILRALRDDIAAAADSVGDAGLEDFLTATLQEHQTMSWMLRSFLG